MGATWGQGCWLKFAVWVAITSGLFVGVAPAQTGGMGGAGMPGSRMSSAGEDKWEKKSQIREDANTGGEASTSAEPYHGQIYCPVSGEKLGLRQPAVSVQTAIGATNPGFMARLFGKKATPGAIVYVCCPKCAETVRQNPQRYLGIVVQDVARLSTTMHYANAPPMHPERQSESVIQPVVHTSATMSPAP